MYLKLYIDGKICDIGDDTSVKLKKEFQDAEELIIKEITYSYELELPVTMTNNQIFGFTSTVSVGGKFDRVYDAQLYANDVLILDGNFILNEIDYKSYKGNLYVPTKKELKDVLGDRTLQEIRPHLKYINDWNDIDRINNYVGNIPDASYPPTNQRDRHICFPYALYSWPYNNKYLTEDRYFQTNDFEDSSFTLNNVFPAFNVLSVLKDMFATDGYNLVGNVFDNPMFSELYQSFSLPYDEYKSKKQTPYYLSLHCDWSLCKYIYSQGKNNVSSSAEEFDDGQFRFWADIPLWSDNAVFSNVDNKYGMMKRSQNADYSENSQVIIVPVSGWYQIHTDGYINLPDKTRYEKGKNVVVTGYESRDDNTSFEYSSYEVQIKKGVPKESPQYYCYNFGLPVIPVEYTEGTASPSVVWSAMALDEDGTQYYWPTSVKIVDSENTRIFGKNGKTTLVKDLSGASTEDFVCGARFGNQRLYKSPSCQCEYREYPKTAMMGLVDVSNAPQIFNNVLFDERYPDNTATYLALYLSRNEYDNTYGRATAQAMVKENSYSNFDGYNVLEINRVDDDTTQYRWDSTSNYRAKRFVGQRDNSVMTSSTVSGNWNVSTCVWLEEGETVYVEVVGAYNHQQDRCTGLNTGCKCSDRKHFWKRGCTNTSLSFNFEMGLITTEEDWVPSTESPILNGDALKRPRYTNVNLFLPNIKCNDYLNSFLQTFNCRLSAIDDTTYSLDFVSTKSESGKVISIDGYCHNKDATFKRISLPSTIELAFKIDKTEEGYVHGNDSEYNMAASRAFSQPEHSGGKVYNNPLNTSGDNKKYESIWSYDWFKSIKDGDGNIFPAPIIADSKLFGDEYTYEIAQGETLKTDYTPRLFYLYNRKVYAGGNLIPRQNYIQIRGEHNFKLLIVDNCLWQYGSVGNEKRYVMIDYDNSQENTGGIDGTLTDELFNINIDRNYFHAEVECILPSLVYYQIGKGTKILFDDALWNLESIDGFDPDENDQCTITLSSYTR